MVWFIFIPLPDSSIVVKDYGWAIAFIFQHTCMHCMKCKIHMHKCLRRKENNEWLQMLQIYSQLVAYNLCLGLKAMSLSLVLLRKTLDLGIEWENKYKYNKWNHKSGTNRIIMLKFGREIEINVLLNKRTTSWGKKWSCLTFTIQKVHTSHLSSQALRGNLWSDTLEEVAEQTVILAACLIGGQGRLCHSTAKI